jgi:hypothetical protein
VEDYLSYSALYQKDIEEPLAGRGSVTPDTLMQQADSGQVFLRSVEKGPLHGLDVANQWGTQAIEMMYRLSLGQRYAWTEDLARKAYRWFSPKTKGATNLFWWNKLLAPMLQGAEGSIQDLPRLTLPQSMRDEAADRYISRLGHRPAYTYYYRHVRDGRYWCLQYWFFYAYNDWARGFNGMNDHEGDWESLMLFFRLDETGLPQSPPAYVTFVGHHSRITKPWDHSDVLRIGTHVIGHVAAGSHATYPEAKRYPIVDLYGLNDYAAGDGVTIDHNQWSHCVSLEDVPWLTAFHGSWGTRYWLLTQRVKSILRTLAPLSPILSLASATLPREMELPGVSAPHGPMIGDTGDERPQWRGPAAWADAP